MSETQPATTEPEGTKPEETKPIVAKINRKWFQRTAVLVVILAVVGYGAFWLLTKKDDPDSIFGPANTAGDIAAIQAVNGDGFKAVIIKPDGTIIQSDDEGGNSDSKFVDGSSDSNPAWSSNGGRLYFDSDRYKQEPHLFRWNPDRGTVDRRTIDTRPKGFITFATPGVDKTGKESTGLMISGGTVVEINASSGQQTQLLPPSSASDSSATSSEGGAQSQMEQIYGSLGTSFVKAMWTKNKHFIIAVMNRDGGDQTLMVQDMTTPNSKPEGIVQGKHIGFDVAPDSGRVVFTVQESEVPDWFTDEEKQPLIKNGKVVPPYYSLVEVLDLENRTTDPTKEKTSGIMLGVPTNAPTKVVFGDPSISPDEKTVAIPVGKWGKDGFESTELLGMPIKPAVGNAAFPIAAGQISHVSWMPDSSAIIAIMPTGPNGKSDVFSIEPKPNGLSKNLTQGQGSGIFVDAVASPQISAPGN